MTGTCSDVPGAEWHQQRELPVVVGLGALGKLLNLSCFGDLAPQVPVQLLYGPLNNAELIQQEVGRVPIVGFGETNARLYWEGASRRIREIDRYSTSQ